MSNIIRVVSYVVDQTQLTIFTESGEVINIKQGDPRLRDILSILTTELAKKPYVDVDLSNLNRFSKFEKKTNGVVKFFSVAKTKLASFFKQKEVINTAKEEKVKQILDEVLKPVTNTEVYVATTNEFKCKVQEETIVPIEDTVVDAVQELVSESKKLPDTEQYEDESDDSELVAVVNNIVIPDVTKLVNHINHALDSDTSPALEKFMLRLSTVMDKRQHSAESLLTFMQKGDLPVAADGSVIIYKVLKKTSKPNVFVDCHTGKVEQWVGAKVQMDEKLVDTNRFNECSNGLHVARRRYIKEFSGDVCVIAKVAPEDVIAVPEKDHNKMRVCAYHIIDVLDSKYYQLLRQDRPITDANDGVSEKLLARIINGDHIGVTDIVTIGGHMGTLVTHTKVNTEVHIPTITEKVATVVLDSNQSNPIPIKEIINKVKKTKQQQLLELSKTKPMTKEIAQEIVAIKKTAKKSWDALGINEKLAKSIVKLTE